MAYVLNLENPNVRARNYQEQLDSNIGANGQELTSTQVYYRTGYLMCMDDHIATALGKYDAVTKHPHIRASEYAKELKTRKSTSNGINLDKCDLALRSGYLQCMNDTAEKFKRRNNALHNTPSARTNSFAEQKAIPLAK